MCKFFVILLFVGASIFSTYAQPYSIQQYLNIRSASAPSFSPDGKSIAYLTNASGTTQVWRIDLPKGQPRQLTDYEDNIAFVRWLADGSGIIFGKAKGGDENTQFYWMKPDGTGVKALTNDPAIRNNFAQVSWDGKTIYYASNKRNRSYFDIYSMDLASGREALIYQQDGNNELAAVNDRGSKFIVSRDGTEFSLDNNLFLVDANTKEETLLTPHTGASQFGNVHFVADGIVFAHNDKREFYSLAQMRKINASGDNWSVTNREVKIVDESKSDVSDIAMEPYPSAIAYACNLEGFSQIYIRKLETGGKPLISTVGPNERSVIMPGQGIVSGITFSSDQNMLAYSFSSPTRNGDIWLYELSSRNLTQVTNSARDGIDQKSYISPELVKFKSFDGISISGWYYKPVVNISIRNGTPNTTINLKTSAIKNLPVIISVHGGPEGQERPGFNALYQYYLSRGYAIFATNVRGSTGYGKTFTHLDDVRKREDSVKDLAAAVEWLKKSGEADPKNIAIMGGSYGGYMTLAAVTLYPDLWAAAVSTVGISNWESFFKNTSGYRKRQREVEYGSMEKDGDFLRSISPISKVDRIKTPLFVIAGRNDPRVPYTEAEQIVGALKKRGAVVQYKLYDDEGHGVSKLKNRLELYPLVADFLDRYLKKTAPQQ